MNKFYQTLHNIQLFLEKKRKKRTVGYNKASDKSQTNRKKRSKNVEITNHESVVKGSSIIHTANAKSEEQSESTKHTCRVKLVKSSKKIDTFNCSCSDFQSRFQYYRNKDEVSSFDKITPIKDIFDPHTREEPEITNPKNEGYMCKHLLAFLEKIKNV